MNPSISLHLYISMSRIDTYYISMDFPLPAVLIHARPAGRRGYTVLIQGCAERGELQAAEKWMKDPETRTLLVGPG